MSNVIQLHGYKTVMVHRMYINVLNELYMAHYEDKDVGNTIIGVEYNG